MAMKIVRQVLNDLQQKRFVGREKELAVMLQELCGINDDWCLLHIHGPGGIGKSALLRAFQRTAQERLILYVDGRSFLYPTHFIEAIRIQLSEAGFSRTDTADESRIGEAEAELLNGIADRCRGIVLLLDSMDRWGTVEPWLREKWLPLLTVRVKVCTAGRYPLDEGMLSATEWCGVYRNIRLNPFNRREIERYTIACGIADPEMSYSIESFSGGIPLALSLACEKVIMHGARSFLEGGQTQAIIASMDRALFQDGKMPTPFKRLLSAASLLWRFDQDMLQWILGEDVPADTFNDFCNLPYVKRFQQGGYGILNAVRKWTNAEMEQRSPETHARYKQRAIGAIERRWMNTAPGNEERKQKLRLEKVFLLSDDFMKGFYFSGDRPNFEIRAASQEHLSILAELFHPYYLSFPPFMSDDTEQIALIDDLWEAEPSSFRVVYCEDKVAGVFTFVPIHEKTRPLFAENCVYSAYIKETPPDDKDYLVWILGVQREYEPEFSSATVQDLLARQITGKRVTVLTPLEGPVESICRLGFERISWADYKSPGGLLWKAARIDLRRDDYFYRIPNVDSNEQSTILPEARVQLVKQMLERYHGLNRESSLLETVGRLIHGRHDQSNEALSAHIGNRIAKILKEWTDGKSQEQMQERILRLFYIERIGSHENVASRLGLPMSTYYRYLKKAFSRLAEELFPFSSLPFV
ncbi:ATP-binding protein [Cohnella sp. AR92]|uniref:ATP-binding protein n=1 Tax=Cohnella sp. AR92 TaxID=648716 RepID=UPI000F8C5B12|nr:ATP-binding protein [Cohnella sp. AR92]RUS43884.1 ATP-binding protein [Cohnella sp. AR92]